VELMESMGPDVLEAELVGPIASGDEAVIVDSDTGEAATFGCIFWSDDVLESEAATFCWIFGSDFGNESEVAAMDTLFSLAVGSSLTEPLSSILALSTGVVSGEAAGSVWAVRTAPERKEAGEAA